MNTKFMTALLMVLICSISFGGVNLTIFLLMVFLWMSELHNILNTSVKAALFFFVINSLGMIWFNSAVIMWLLIEAQSLAFIMACAHLSGGPATIKSSEVMFKYFLISSVGGFLMLSYQASMMSNYSYWASSYGEFFPTLFFLTMVLIKLGMFPLSFWVPEVMGGMSWESLGVLMVMPKLTLLAVLYKLVPFQWFLHWVGVASFVMGLVGVYNQNCLKSLLACGGISSMGFMLLSLNKGEMVKFGFILFGFFYFMALMVLMHLLKQSDINNLGMLTSFIAHNAMVSLVMLMVLMSFLGLPPFMGFFTKMLMLVNFALKTNIFFVLMTMVTIVVSTFVYLSVATLAITSKNSNLEAFVPPTSMNLLLSLLSMSFLLLGFIVSVPMIVMMELSYM